MKLLTGRYRFITIIASIHLLVGLCMNSLGQDKAASTLPDVQRLSASELLKRATRQAEPVFPEDALVAQLNGSQELAVEVTVNESGEVIAARAVSGFSLLKDAAIEAARKWKFASSRKELEREPQSWLAHCRLGRAYMRSKQYREAEEEYKRAISLNPESYDVPRISDHGLRCKIAAAHPGGTNEEAA